MKSKEERWHEMAHLMKDQKEHWEKIDRDNKYYWCSDQANAWIDKNATHVWEIDGDPLRQGYYLNRSGKKELVFGSYCDNK